MLRLLMLIAICSSLLAGCNSTTRVKPNTVSNKKYKVNKDIVLPLQTKVAVYVPNSKLKSEFFAVGRIHKPGKALTEATHSIFNNYFNEFSWFESKQDAQYVFKLDPTWDLEAGDLKITLNYEVFTSDGNSLFKDEVVETSGYNYLNSDAGFYNSSYKAMLAVLSRFVNKHASQVSNIPLVSLAGFDLDKLINEKPISTGTGFYINQDGDLLTAAHVLRSCLVTKVKVGDEYKAVQADASSTLLDLAVIKSGKESSSYLQLPSENSLELGEKLTSVSYPLEGLLESSPNMTFGNITSVKGLSGSKSTYQFSAPVQPGSSGGPLVSDNNELLGVTTSSLNTKSLIEQGVIPQNVNFATTPEMIKKFLNKHNIPFKQGKRNDIVSTKLTLESTTSIACYQ
ncbi:S1 family peptidase [Pseudoalteromonas byunsanensis]|nr:serine protease [Pseudoalteromonas byunsanensis]